MTNPLAEYRTEAGEARRFQVHLTDQELERNIYGHPYGYGDRVRIPETWPRALVRQIENLCQRDSGTSISALAYLMQREAWVAWVSNLGEFPTDFNVEIWRDVLTRTTNLCTTANTKPRLITPMGIWEATLPDPNRPNYSAHLQTIAPTAGQDNRRCVFIDLRQGHITGIEPKDMLTVRYAPAPAVVDSELGYVPGRPTDMRYSVGGQVLPHRLGAHLHHFYPNTGAWQLHAALAMANGQGSLARFVSLLTILGDWPIYAIDAATYTDHLGIQCVRIYVYGCLGAGSVPEEAEVIGNYGFAGNDPGVRAGKISYVADQLAKPKPPVAIHTPRFNSKLSRRLSLPTNPVEDNQHVPHLSNKEHQNSINLRFARRNPGAAKPRHPGKPD